MQSAPREATVFGKPDAGIPAMVTWPESLWTRHRSSATEKGWEQPAVTADSVAMRGMGQALASGHGLRPVLRGDVHRMAYALRDGHVFAAADDGGGREGFAHRLHEQIGLDAGADQDGVAH